jgi:xylulokinase
LRCVATVEQCEEFNQEFGGAEGLIERIGNPMLPGYTAPKLLWLKENEPANFQRLTSVLLPHDYLNFWLTGERQMEYGDASGTGFLDVRSRKWSKPILDFIDPRVATMLPPLRLQNVRPDCCGACCAKNGACSDDAPVSAERRHMMSAIGTGNIRAWVLTVSLELQ